MTMTQQQAINSLEVARQMLKLTEEGKTNSKEWLTLAGLMPVLLKSEYKLYYSFIDHELYLNIQNSIIENLEAEKKYSFRYLENYNEPDPLFYVSHYGQVTTCVLMTLAFIEAVKIANYSQEDNLFVMQHITEAMELAPTYYGVMQDMKLSDEVKDALNVVAFIQTMDNLAGDRKPVPFECPPVNEDFEF